MESHSGKELKKLRESKGITLGDAARGTRLSSAIIEAIETDGTCDLLSPIYMDLSRRTYARFLGDAGAAEPQAKTSPSEQPSEPASSQAAQDRSKRGRNSPA